MPAPRTKPTHQGRTTDPSPRLSRDSLEFLDGLLDGVTLSAQAEDMEATAKLIATARREVDALLTASGGVPLRVQRAQGG
jgi:hypothetical protein